MKITTSDNRVFTLDFEEPYLREDGVLTALKIWRSHCVACGAAFTVSTPSGVVDFSGSKSFGQVHCPLHKLSREEVALRRATHRNQDAIK